MKIIAFLDNKYAKWYWELIEKRSRDPAAFSFEKHHPIPKSMGGTKTVKLTPREHFIAHLLLTKMTSGKALRQMRWAMHRLAYSKNQSERLSSIQYEMVRKIHIQNLKEDHPAHRSCEWGEKISERVYNNWQNNPERRQKTSERFKKTMADNPELFKKNRILASRKGIIAIREKNKFKIEYKGEYFYSWQHLYKEKKVSKRLYKKYYMNGVDPEFRIGKNGPISKRKEASE